MLRIYYSNDEYELGRHKILTTYTDRTPGAMPEDRDKPLSNYSVIEVEERYNPNWYKLFESQEAGGFWGFSNEFYVNNNGEIVNADTEAIIAINSNPQKESFKLSQLYGLTQAQLETYIENNVTNLAQANAFLKKLSAVVLWLVKQTKLDG